MILHWLDYLILGIIVLSLLMGIFRGIVREIFLLAGWVVSILLALHYMDRIEVLLQNTITIPTIRSMIAFAGIFMVSMFVLAFINNILGKIIHKTGLKGIDRLLGMFFGIVRGIVILTILFWMGGMYDATALAQKPWNQSQLLPHFKPLLVWMDELSNSSNINIKQYIQQLKQLNITPSSEVVNTSDVIPKTNPSLHRISQR